MGWNAYAGFDFRSCRGFSDGQTAPMNTITLMAVALAGWINPRQQDVIEYLREEVRGWRTRSSSRSSERRGKGW